MSELNQQEYGMKSIASNVIMVKDQIRTLRSAIDWDVKSRSGIDTSMGS